MSFLHYLFPDKHERRLAAIAKLPIEQRQMYKPDGSGLDIDAVWKVKIPLLHMNNREYLERYKQRRKTYEQRYCKGSAGSR